MAQPIDTFLACVRPKFFSNGLNLDKILGARNRFFKSRACYLRYAVANSLFRGDFPLNWNNDHTAQIMINTGMVKHFIEDGGIGEPPKISKYKKYGTIFPSGIRVCMASIIAIAHSPFYTGEYYSKLSPLWQKIAQKVRPTYKVVLRSAVDDLLGPSGVLWRPVILPKVYKYLINSETDVFDDISIMPWHSFPNVQINRQPLPVTSELPELSVEPKRMRGVGVQTDTFPAIVAAIAKEAQIGSKKIRVKIHMSRKLEIEDCELMKVFNRMMEREMHQYKAFDENHTEIPIIMSDEALAANQWFPVVIIKRSQSVENLIASLQDGEPAAKRKPSELECASASD